MNSLRLTNFLLIVIALCVIGNLLKNQSVPVTAAAVQPVKVVSMPDVKVSGVSRVNVVDGQMNVEVTNSEVPVQVTNSEVQCNITNSSLNANISADDDIPVRLNNITLGSDLLPVTVKNIELEKYGHPKPTPLPVTIEEISPLAR